MGKESVCQGEWAGMRVCWCAENHARYIRPRVDGFRSVLACVVDELSTPEDISFVSCSFRCLASLSPSSLLHPTTRNHSYFSTVEQ